MFPYPNNQNNNSSFAPDASSLNQTQPLSDWVIERMRKNQPRQVQPHHTFTGTVVTAESRQQDYRY